jgi:RimJ/RimL family protein N-acetyltransferase
LGGSISAPLLTQIITYLRQSGDVVVGLWQEDPRFNLLPPEPDYDGFVLEFYDRPRNRGLEKYLSNVPEGCTIRPLDRNLIMRTQWGPDAVRDVGGIEIWEKTCFGFCLMHDDEILCEATVGVPATGLREPGVFTQEAHRGQGYATITAAHLIRKIEASGDHTYWNCAKQNVASAAVARKLGYRIEKEYRLLGWNRYEK